MSSEKNNLCLISLSDHVLLHVFKNLNWIDSINLAATCKRMKNVKYWINKQNQKIDLAQCVVECNVSLEKLLTVIGPYIKVVKVTEDVITESFVKKCNNIKSVEIGGCVSKSVAITLNEWMKNTKIDSLSIGQEFDENVEELLRGITGLNSFVFDSFQKLLPSNFFDNNSTLQHLLLVLGDDSDLALDLSSLHVLHNLRSLSVTTEKTDILDRVRNYVQMKQLEEFSILILEDNWDKDIFGNFLEYLAKNSKIDKLRITGVIDIDCSIFSKLNLFDLTSLWLDVAFTWEDFSTALKNTVAHRIKYLRLEWPVSWCSSAKIGCVLQSWATVEAICLNSYDPSNLVHHFSDQFFFDILKMSDSRPRLKLHIFSSEVSFRDALVEVCYFFFFLA